jgi:hypothetical protein
MSVLTQQPTEITRHLLEIAGPLMGTIVPERFQGISEVDKWGRCNTVLSWCLEQAPAAMWRQIIATVEFNLAHGYVKIKVITAAWRITDERLGRLCYWKNEVSGWVKIPLDKATLLEQQDQRDEIANHLKPTMQRAYIAVCGWNVGHLTEKTYLRK